MKKPFLLVSLASALFFVSVFKGYGNDVSEEEIKLYLNEVRAVPASNPTRIVISNPNIVDVTNATKDEITISPKAIGAANLVFWDNFGEQSYRIKVFAEDIGEIKRRVDSLLATTDLPGVYSQGQEDEGKVLLLGQVRTSQDREKALTVLGTLKDKIIDLIEIKEEEAVIDIDVQVLELSQDATKTLGFTWPGNVTLTEAGSAGIAAAGTKWSNLFNVLNLNRAAFTWSLDALVQEGKARILSRPRLACQSGKEAELLVGGEKPTFTTSVQSTAGSSTEVDYKEYGIKLKIKPTVTKEKRIKLALNVEISEVGDAEIIGSASAPTAKAYPLTKRSASTELFLDDEQTLAIGGLIKQKNEEDTRKTAGLGDMPVLGLFFKKNETKVGGGHGERGNAELFITLTPTIAKEGKEVVKDKKEIKPKNTQPLAAIDAASDVLKDYAAIIQRRILNNLVYPIPARQAKFQGTTRLGLRFSCQGKLLEAKIKTSSGHKLLDDNAIAVVKKITYYPPFPPQVKQKELLIEIPIIYQLD